MGILMSKINTSTLVRTNLFILLLLFVFNTEIKAQRKKDMIYTAVDSGIFNSDSSQNHKLNLFFGTLSITLIMSLVILKEERMPTETKRNSKE